MSTENSSWREASFSSVARAASGMQIQLAVTDSIYKLALSKPLKIPRSIAL